MCSHVALAPQVYFGRLGDHAASLTAYLERIPGEFTCTHIQTHEREYMHVNNAFTHI